MARLNARAAGLALAAWAAATGPAAALEPGDAAPALAPRDVRGRPLAVPAPGRVMLLSFASDSTGEAVGEITRAIRVEHPQLEILALIDLSRFPGFARGFVAREIAKRHDAAVERTREAFVRAGKPAPDDLDARIHTVPDFEAKACERYGAGDAGSQPRIVLVGAEGRVAAVFTRTPMLAEVEAAVARTLGGARSP